MFKTAIITGSTGWVGSTLEAYLKQNHPNIVICKTNRKCELDLMPEGETALFHFAFPTKDKTLQMSPKSYHDSVLELRQNVINLIKKVQPAKMVYTSSGAVYKSGSESFVESYEEDAYGFLKLEEERLFTEIAQERNIKLIIPRIFALAGGFINKPQIYLLANFITQAVKTGKIVINAKSRVFRSYIHILDVFDICLKYFNSSLQSPYIFETKGQNIMELNDVAFAISAALKINIEVIRHYDYSFKENNYYPLSNSLTEIMQNLEIKKLRSFEDCILDTKNNLF